MEKEIRTLNTEIRSSEDRKIEGTAIVFNQLSEDLGGFREQISPSAVDGVIEQSDIFMLYNHNRDRGYLARSRNGKGTLNIEVREDGVYFHFDAPHTALADEVREHMINGDLNQCSFAFTVLEDRWAKQEDGSYIRTIDKFGKLFDFSLVDTPAYPQTSASCKRFAEVLEEEKAENEKKMKEQEEREIAEAHNKLMEEYKSYMKVDDNQNA